MHNCTCYRIIPNCVTKAKTVRTRCFIGDEIEECKDLSGLYYLLPFQKVGRHLFQPYNPIPCTGYMNLLIAHIPRVLGLSGELGGREAALGLYVWEELPQGEQLQQQQGLALTYYTRLTCMSRTHLLTGRL